VDLQTLSSTIMAIVQGPGKGPDDSTYLLISWEISALITVRTFPHAILGLLGPAYS
jgi:hypothetical protein